MNKYEMRAEAVLKKREEYNIKRAEKANRAVKIVAAVAACIAVVASVEFASKYLVKKPIAPEVVPKPTESVAATLQYAYNGKPVFVSKEIEKLFDLRIRKVTLDSAFILSKLAYHF